MKLPIPTLSWPSECRNRPRIYPNFYPNWNIFAFMAAASVWNFWKKLSKTAPIWSRSSTATRCILSREWQRRRHTYMMIWRRHDVPTIRVTANCTLLDVMGGGGFRMVPNLVYNVYLYTVVHIFRKKAQLGTNSHNSRQKCLPRSKKCSLTVIWNQNWENFWDFRQKTVRECGKSWDQVLVGIPPNQSLLTRWDWEGRGGCW